MLAQQLRFFAAEPQTELEVQSFHHHQVLLQLWGQIFPHLLNEMVLVGEDNNLLDDLAASLASSVNQSGLLVTKMPIVPGG